MSKHETRQCYSYHWEVRYRIRETSAVLISSSLCLSSLPFSLQRSPWSLSVVSSAPLIQAESQVQGVAVLTSPAIVLPSPPAHCTRVVPAGLQSPLSLQPGKWDDIEFPRYMQSGVEPGQDAVYLRPYLKPWLLSHLSYFLSCLPPVTWLLWDAVSSMWFCMLHSGLSSPSKILVINWKTWRRKDLRRKSENVLVKICGFR